MSSTVLCRGCGIRTRIHRSSGRPWPNFGARAFSPVRPCWLASIRATDFPKSATRRLPLLVFTAPLVQLFPHSDKQTHTGSEPHTHLRTASTLGLSLVSPFGPVRQDWLYLDRNTQGPPRRQSGDTLGRDAQERLWALAKGQRRQKNNPRVSGIFFTDLYEGNMIPAYLRGHTTIFCRCKHVCTLFKVYFQVT